MTRTESTPAFMLFFYETPACETITMNTEGMLCGSNDDDSGSGGIDPWRPSGDPIRF